MTRLVTSTCAGSLALSAVLLLVVVSPLSAGGAWVPERGHGDLQLGLSRKTAHTSWDAFGQSFENLGRFQNHDFRYLYLSGETGVARDLSLTYVVTWLHGLEGPDGDLRENTGFSDAWLGLKYRLREGRTPVALRLVVRTPVLYDIDGPYSRELVDDDGTVRESPEWRGLLKHDVTLGAAVSRSLRGGKGWASLEAGYTWREGAPADQVPIYVEAGWTLPWWGIRPKVSVLHVQSLGNDSEARPDDRFGARPTFNFNDASMGRATLSFLVPLDRQRRFLVEAGYGLWVWGRSARQYEEPFVSFSRSF